MNVWMRITRDKYELPDAVADSASELAKICGVSKYTIKSSIHQAKQKGYRSRYIKVKIEED